MFSFPPQVWVSAKWKSLSGDPSELQILHTSWHHDRRVEGSSKAPVRLLGLMEHLPSFAWPEQCLPKLSFQQKGALRGFERHGKHNTHWTHLNPLNTVESFLLHYSYMFEQVLKWVSDTFGHGANHWSWPLSHMVAQNSSFPSIR